MDCSFKVFEGSQNDTKWWKLLITFILLTHNLTFIYIYKLIYIDTCDVERWHSEHLTERLREDFVWDQCHNTPDGASRRIPCLFGPLTSPASRAAAVGLVVSPRTSRLWFIYLRLIYSWNQGRVALKWRRVPPACVEMRRKAEREGNGDALSGCTAAHRVLDRFTSSLLTCWKKSEVVSKRYSRWSKVDRSARDYNTVWCLRVCGLVGNFWLTVRWSYSRYFSSLQ